MFEDSYYGFERPVQLNQAHSLEDVRKARIPRDSSVPFFHATEDLFFIKKSDPDGMGATIRAFEFHEVEISDLEPVTMTRAEFNEWKELLNNAKLIIQQAGKPPADPAESTTVYEAEPVPKPAPAGHRAAEKQNARRGSGAIVEAVP